MNIIGKLHALFGGLNMTWPKTIIFATIMGVYTALMAMLVPDGNSFHDIAVTPEWWIVPAILVIVNCKIPLEAALKVFVFFLISQPLVYLIQVPFNYMGWELFGYYRYWFIITLFTFPAGFIGWYAKKDKWYSGLIISSMTALLAYFGIGYIYNCIDNFPNHFISIIYCFASIPIIVLGLFRKKQPRIIATLVTLTVIVVVVLMASFSKPFEVYRYSFSTHDDNESITLEYVGEPHVSFWTGARGSAEVINGGDLGYGVKLIGERNQYYRFSLTDESGTEYNFEYYYDEPEDTVIVKLLNVEANQNQTE